MRPAAFSTAAGLLAVAGILVFMGLLYSNHRLRARIEALEASLRRAQRQVSSRVVRTGERFEDLRVQDLVGRAQLLAARGRESGALVAIVNPDCDSCRAVADEVEAYVGARGAMPVWLLSVSDAETTRAFAARRGLEPVTYRLPDDLDPLVRQRLSSVPQVFVVDGHERVIRTCESVARCL